MLEGSLRQHPPDPAVLLDEARELFAAMPMPGFELPGVGAAAGRTSYVRSGWMIQPDGTIKLNTPFSGFTRQNMLAQYSRIRLITDRFESEGATRGMVGYVIEVYPDGNYEVEFSDKDGTTVAQIVAGKEDVVHAPE